MMVVFGKTSLTTLRVGEPGIYGEEKKIVDLSWRLNLRVEIRDLKEHYTCYLCPASNVKCFFFIQSSPSKR